MGIAEIREIKNGYKKPGRGINSFSKKRQEENKLYFKESREFREKNPKCKIGAPGCKGKTQGVHHKKGRGKYLRDQGFWIPACNPCNLYVSDHPEWALKNGFIESRLKK